MLELGIPHYREETQMNKVLWNVCSCGGGLVSTYNGHFFGLFPVCETELFALELKRLVNKWAELVSFKGKNYQKRDSILRSTSRPNFSHREELYLVIQVLNLNFRVLEHVQLPVETCSSHLVNLGMVLNILLHLFRSVVT